MRIAQILLFCLMVVSSVADGETNRTLPADGKGFAWESPIPPDCPFPGSPSLTGLFFTGRHSDYRCGDTFYPSWASDGNLYSPWTDGKTWEPSPHSAEKPLFPEPEKFLAPVKMGAPHFVDFGKNMEHSPDGKAYLIRQAGAMACVCTRSNCSNRQHRRRIGTKTLQSRMKNLLK